MANLEHVSSRLAKLALYSKRSMDFNKGMLAHVQISMLEHVP